MPREATYADDEAVQAEQIARLKALRTERDEARVTDALARIATAAQDHRRR